MARMVWNHILSLEPKDSPISQGKFLRLAKETATPSEAFSVHLSKFLASGPGRGYWDSETTSRTRRWKACQGSGLSEDTVQFCMSLSCGQPPPARGGGREGHPLLLVLLTSGSQRDAHSLVNCLDSGPAEDADLHHPNHPGHLESTKRDLDN